MKKLRCIIIDDEPVAIKIIREFANKVHYLELAAEFLNTSKAGAFLKENHIDLIFLDIAMPKVSGLEWLRNNTIEPVVILTTAFPEHAIESYELNVLDYLLKPISFHRFMKAVEKGKEYLEMKSMTTTPRDIKWIFVRTEKRIEKVDLDDILYIETKGNYVHVITEKRSLLAYLTIKSIEAQLPAPPFIKIHQSFIINSSKIDVIEGNRIKIGNKYLPIGRSYRETVTQFIDTHTLKR